MQDHASPRLAIQRLVPELWPLMGQYRQPWAIAGGWAVDLYLGRVTRHHGDLEIAVLRRDQWELHDLFSGWSISYLDAGKIQSWPRSLRLELPIHQIRVTSPQDQTLDFLLNEAEGDQWLYRRDQRITLPLGQAILGEDLPYLAPEIVLLFKSKQPRPKDEKDLDLLLPVLMTDALSWLRNCLRVIAPDHSWLDRM
ncbi:MAG: hypothetical protein R3F54_23315 [Alphaproteobacteria bacterium]